MIKRAYYTTTSLLEQYQQGGCSLFEWWGKPEYPEKNHCKLVQNRQNRVNITKQSFKAIGLPVGMGNPNRQATQGRKQRELPRGYTLSVTSRINCIVTRCLINVVYLTACCLYQVIMTLHFLNDVANEAELTYKSKMTS